MLAEHVLSQLSYTPLDRLSASNHLVEVNGFEPMTSCLQSTRSPNWAIPPVRLCFHSWWAREDLNLRPHAYQACALTSWATSPSLLLPGSHIRIGSQQATWTILTHSNGKIISLERRWSSRRFPYGYLVTTSPQSSTLPWSAASIAS